MIEDSQLYSAIICCFQQVLGQQALVYRRSNFSDKDSVVAILIRLIVAGEKRKQGEAPHIGGGVNDIAIVLLILQDKRVCVICTSPLCGPTLSWSVLYT